ncbi:glycerate kinase [Salisediminibacterium halotolerans]|uniref:glycerate kinase n=1 Tax=Salisediminibacterium halotolerans TaxID=517425 RepID=UPI000EB367FE|nr:glycerate kinase [Salisediminibacterium halotolerans]RLJ75673.1 glycerate kinase [Actinophytocola xinjiangensis]RPE89527.1 glycerate kinase [Salisediminibacterium halotolerans]TWG36286.1 glycerate kinase [Salisediminibacterium halotolerans]GEL07366.1 glycerate kinase [Salisediminibacterium halotolerans]
MNILIAPDSFKETLTAGEAADTIAKGLRRGFPAANLSTSPMADGGEGTVDALVEATNGRYVSADVEDPLGRTVTARYGLLGDGETAAIEMAEASGIHLVAEDERDPKITSTFGTGELIRDALDHGVTNMIIGIGGSATNDGGAGMAEALGARFLDANREPVARGGSALNELAVIDTANLDPRLKNVRFRIACDVDNPLTGERGASAVFGPQKGASADDIAQLDAALARYAGYLARDVSIDPSAIPGSGAAGGLGAGMVAFLDAELESGATIVADETNLAAAIARADLVITGEGGINHQTVYGKTPIHVAKLAKTHNLPVIALCGTISLGYETVFDAGIDAVFSAVTGPVTFDELKADPITPVATAAENLGRLLAMKLSS